MIFLQCLKRTKNGRIRRSGTVFFAVPIFLLCVQYALNFRPRESENFVLDEYYRINKKFIYVYDLPPRFNTGMLSENMFELFPGTKYAQWQSEFYIHQLLKNNTCVTANADQATIFFVPIYGSGMRTMSPSEKSNFWSSLLAWLKDQKSSSGISYYDRKDGFDHVFPFGASRSWCKVSQPNLKSPKCLGLTHKSLFEYNFIKLSVEFTGLEQKHLITLNSMEKLSRIIIIPYMHYDERSALGFNFSGLVSSDDTLPKKRKYLLYFSGSLLPKTAPFRATFKEVCDSYQGCLFTESGRRIFNTTKMSSSFHMSNFCAVLGGDSRASKRFFDAMTSYCIPVVFDPMLVLPFLDSIPYDKFVVRAPFIRDRDTVLYVLQELSSIPLHRIIEMREEIKKYRSHLSYLSPSRPNAIDMIIRRLYLRGEAFSKFPVSRTPLFEAGYRDWSKFSNQLCGSSGIVSCSVHSQHILKKF